MKRKVCRTCKLFVTEDICPICRKASFSNSFNGLVTVLDAKRSVIAQKMGFEANGEYVVKVK
jgi:DNA-directed RNA polymerase subunit E"